MSEKVVVVPGAHSRRGSNLSGGGCGNAHPEEKKDEEVRRL